MIEAIAETDEELMIKYLEGEEITEEELIAALRKATIANEIVSMYLWFFIQKQRCSTND